MYDEIIKVEAIPSAKRARKLAEAYAAQVDMPSPFSTWQGILITQEVKEKIFNLISESGNKVIDTSLENDRRNRAEKHLWAQIDRKGNNSKRDYSSKIHRQLERKSFFNRVVDIIP